MGDNSGQVPGSQPGPHLYSRAEHRERAAKGLDTTIQPFRLSDREKVHILLRVYADDEDERIRAHKVRIQRIAHAIGRSFAARRVTRQEADRRLFSLIEEDDPTFAVKKRYLPEEVASSIVYAAFDEGAENG